MQIGPVLRARAATLEGVEYGDQLLVLAYAQEEGAVHHVRISIKDRSGETWIDLDTEESKALSLFLQENVR